MGDRRTATTHIAMASGDVEFLNGVDRVIRYAGGKDVAGEEVSSVGGCQA